MNPPTNHAPLEAPPPVSPALAALLYATQGWPVLPLHHPLARGCSCGRHGCRSIGKHPRIRGGAHAASTDLDQIEQHWTRWPQANIGIATGRLVVVDVDGTAGETALTGLEQAHASLPVTAAVLTGRGRHLYFLADERRIGNGALAPGLHIRGIGGYVVAPPSRHASGHIYRWSQTAPPAQLPSWLAALLGRADPAPGATAAVVVLSGSRGERYVRRALAQELHAIATAPPGARNITLNRSAFRLGQLAGTGLVAIDELRDPLLAAAATAGLPAAEARATVDSGLTAGRQHPRRIAAGDR